jgi:hypothetical protein
MLKLAPSRSDSPLTLRAYLDGPRSALPARIDIAKRLVTAVARLHERGDVHGHLDPSAIILIGTRTHKIELRTDDEEPPVSGMRDMRYRAPELEASPRGDVFALGAILRQLLDDPALPCRIERVLSVMTEHEPSARYVNAQVAMCAFARAAL